VTRRFTTPPGAIGRTGDVEWRFPEGRSGEFWVQDEAGSWRYAEPSHHSLRSCEVHFTELTPIDERASVPEGL
jgi:hypothetical protein